MYFNWVLIGLLNFSLFFLLVMKKSSFSSFELVSSESSGYFWNW